MSVRTFPSPVETAEDLPGFCSDCGRRLVVEERTHHFDTVTGAPVLVAYAFCRGSWLDRLLGGGEEFHDSFVVNPRPRGNAIMPAPKE